MTAKMFNEEEDDNQSILDIPTKLELFDRGKRKLVVWSCKHPKPTLNQLINHIPCFISGPFRVFMYEGIPFYDGEVSEYHGFRISSKRSNKRNKIPYGLKIDESSASYSNCFLGDNDPLFKKFRIRGDYKNTKRKIVDYLLANIVGTTRGEISDEELEKILANPFLAEVFSIFSISESGRMNSSDYDCIAFTISPRALTDYLKYDREVGEEEIRDKRAVEPCEAVPRKKHLTIEDLEKEFPTKIDEILSKQDYS